MPQDIEITVPKKETKMNDGKRYILYILGDDEKVKELFSFCF